MLFRNTVFLAAALIIPGVAEAKDTKFWNLTANKITSLQLSEPGKGSWGPNQAENDNDRSVDHDERLKITDVKSGVYDIKFTDATGRSCVVKNVAVEEGKVFSINENAVAGCKS